MKRLAADLWVGLRTGPARAGLAFFSLALGLFAVQVMYSQWWMARFRFGPAEWLWRSLTYWKLQPMRHPVPFLG